MLSLSKPTALYYGTIRSYLLTEDMQPGTYHQSAAQLLACGSDLSLCLLRFHSRAPSCFYRTVSDLQLFNYDDRAH